MKSIRQAGICMALALAATTAQAATIALLPSSATVAQGAAFTVDLNLDASDAPGAHPGLYGGQIVLDFDPGQLQYTGFTLANGVSFFSAPVVGSSGDRTTITLGFDNAADTGRVGTFSFTTLPSAGTTATLNIEDSDQFFGTFVSYTPTYQPFYPTFVDTSVQVVPLPGAAVLFLTALGVAATRARRLVIARIGA